MKYLELAFKEADPDIPYLGIDVLSGIGVSSAVPNQEPCHQCDRPSFTFA